MRIKGIFFGKPLNINYLIISILLVFFFSGCEKKLEEPGADNIITYNNLIRHQAYQRINNSDITSSLYFIDSVRTAEQVELNSVTDFQLECLRIEIYQRFGKLDSAALLARNFVERIYNLPEQKNVNTFYARIYFKLSDINYQLKSYTDAYRLLYLGKKIGSEANDKYILSEYYYRLAMIQYAQEFYLRAITSFKICFKESNAIINKDEELLFRQQEVLNNIGLSYYKVDKLDSAEYFYNRALDFCNKNKSEFDERNASAAKGVIIGNLGQLYAKKKEFNRAKIYLKKSIQINNNEIIGSADALLQAIHLGNIYLQTNELDSTRQILDYINYNQQKLYNINDKVNHYKLESEYYKKINDIDKFLFFINLQKVLEEENDKNLTKITVLEQLKFAENDLKYKYLEDKNETNTIWLIVSAIFLLVTFIIIFLVFLNLKKSKNNIKVLEILNNKVNQQANELKTNNLEKDKILRVVAHDLRNPIGGINSIAKIMLMDSLRDSDREMVELIDNTSKDALILINDILEFTNDSHDNDQIIEKLNINQLVNNVVTLLKFKTNEKKQIIIFKPLKRDVFIYGDREKLTRVFNNLINNASKFSQEDKTIEVNIEVVQKMVIISVKDQGIGIQDEFKGGEIESLSGNKRRGTAGEKSFGMGLSIANQIITKHDGKLWFISSKDGTTFYVELPLPKK